MFTGLIETTGTVLQVKQKGGMPFASASPRRTLAGRWHMGDSIAVNGVCLTALDVEEADEKHPGRFDADLAAETVERTTLTRLRPGSLVNLELPTPAGSPLGGHVVQGHIDASATLVSLVSTNHLSEFSDWRMTLEIPLSLTAYIVPQGSITVDGISLTVARDRRYSRRNRHHPAYLSLHAPAQPARRHAGQHRSRRAVRSTLLGSPSQRPPTPGPIMRRSSPRGPRARMLSRPRSPSRPSRRSTRSPSTTCSPTATNGPPERTTQLDSPASRRRLQSLSV